MRILLIGGNGFIGRFAVAALKQQGHAIAVFHRGTTTVPAGVDEILGDRNQLNAITQGLKRFAPDVVAAPARTASATGASWLRICVRPPHLCTEPVKNKLFISIEIGRNVLRKRGSGRLTGGKPYGEYKTKVLFAYGVRLRNPAPD